MAGNARPRSLSLSFFTLFLAMAVPAIAGEAPFLMAHKKVDVSRPKSGVERLAVSIDLYNEGSTTAYDVILNDDSWAQGTFEVVSGGFSNTWERLEPGTTVTHSFVLESKVKKIFYGKPAVVKYRVPTKAVLQEAFSTPIPPLDILADKPPAKKFEWAQRLVAKYGSLVTVLTLVGTFFYVLINPSKSGPKGSKKKR